MPETTLTQCFTDLLRGLEEHNLKPPASIQLANKEEALRIVGEMGPTEWFTGSTSSWSVTKDIESGMIQGFLLYGIEFWWRPAIVAIEIPQGLREAA
jgi:hypothetical protein